MKMVKSLLLGTAAGFVAIAGAQAADLPVKAKPVQYVKICSLYGAGFYYIPGTDTCLKIGGWARVYDAFGVNGNTTNGNISTGSNNSRTTQNLGFKVRGYITADARNQTEYGTLRSYIALGYSSGGASIGVGSGNTTAPGTNTTNFPYDNGVGFSANRAFIQFAGFTFGVTQSFYDFYSQAAVSFWGGSITPASDTGDAGDFIFGAYTMQFGGGLSSTLALEAPRTTSVLNGSSTTMFVVNGTGTLGVGPASSAEALQWPDIVLNLRMDAAWGAAQIMGAIHNANATYYAGTGVPAGVAGSAAAGHPGDAVGWAIGAGVKINTPMIGPGDYFQTQINYTEGARKYVDASYNNMYAMFNGSSMGIGIGSDGVFATGTGVELTTAWGVDASYEHIWSKKWQTAVYGSYTETSYNAAANAMLCTAETVAAFRLNGATCNNNFQTWDVGTRTQFNLDASTYLGVDVVYETLKTGLSGMLANYGNGVQTAGTGPRTVSDQSAWMVQFRVHRNFYP
jgi:Porin subfamily